MTVRVRFAPSPTGEPHIGNIRTVVFNWLFARKMGGQFILRIEDTDRVRYQPQSIPVIMEGLRWLGLDWDEGPSLEELRRLGVEDPERYAVGGPHGPYVQSERLALYKRVAEELIERGWAYRCNCTPERLEQVRARQRARKQMVMYDRHCRDLPPGAISPDEPHVIRLKVPLTGQTVVHDIIKGDIVFENAGIDDQVLLKSDGFPTYHLAVVVDDHYMKITHIARGDDWISSTPKRILIYRAMGWEVPTYCHVPLVLGEDGRKLSKRHGATSITEFRDQGYLPEALFNFLALLGWSPGGGEEREIFSRKELIERFDLFRVNRAPAIFSYDKLDWMNGVYIRKLSQADLLERLLPFWQRAGLVPDPCPEEMRERLRRIVPLVQERLKRLDEVVEWTAFLFREIEAPPAEKLVGKRMTPEESLAALRQARSLLAEVEPFEPEAMEPPMRALAAELGLKAGQLFGIVRWAVTGQKVAPPLFGSLAVLGRERVLARLDAAEAALLTR
ncbi:MAG: glutamate--tRNA ligase [Chloroflexi bacterium]|nr:MAG: glutamate--tRNA ligase [Chloroflexota bacterium]RLC92430.1 MAG: glutamate--tRNA ligase [Chloroflexota bacterium]HEY66721.1 glutamate--tRNA ligase [Thermoflexia bacterium]